MSKTNIPSSITEHKGGERTEKYISKNIISRFLVANFLSQVRALVNEVTPETVHEVGCGEGQILSQIIEDNISVVGSDISENCLEIAAKELPKQKNLRLIKKNIYELNPAKHSADLIICCEVLEHLEDPEKAMKILSLITKKNLIISVPREPLWRVLNIFRFAYLTRLGNTPGHLNHWSKKSLIHFVSRHMDIIVVKSPIPWTMLLCKPKTFKQRLQ